MSGNTIGIIGTETTITSKAYNKAFSKYPDYEIYSIACPLFVPIVEEGWDTPPSGVAVKKNPNPPPRYIPAD